jgi:SET domain-containing protein
MMDVGIGLYSSASLINHSCDPNVEITNYGDIMVVRATRNIAAGEEAAMSYGPLYYKVGGLADANSYK